MRMLLWWDGAGSAEQSPITKFVDGGPHDDDLGEDGESMAFEFTLCRVFASIVPNLSNLKVTIVVVLP